MASTFKDSRTSIYENRHLQAKQNRSVLNTRSLLGPRLVYLLVCSKTTPTWKSRDTEREIDKYCRLGTWHNDDLLESCSRLAYIAATATTSTTVGIYTYYGSPPACCCHFRPLMLLPTTSFWPLKDYSESLAVFPWSVCDLAWRADKVAVHPIWLHPLSPAEHHHAASIHHTLHCWLWCMTRNYLSLHAQVTY